MRGLALGLIALASPALAGVHPPEVEKQLAFIAGDWTIKGLEANYRDHCTWFDANSFIVCDTTDHRKANHHSIAILGWSAADGHYTYQQYDDSGRGRTEPCYANSEKGLTCLGQAQTKDGPGADAKLYLANGYGARHPPGEVGERRSLEQCRPRRLRPANPLSSDVDGVPKTTH